jgi:hypothetical protein
LDLENCKPSEIYHHPKAAMLRKFGKIARYPESLHASFERI